MKIRQIYGLRDTIGDIGIELEMEYAEQLPTVINGRDQVFNKHWKVGLDGSLRGAGCEYSTRGPRKMGDVPEALEGLKPYLGELFKPRVSSRAATHFHINCQERTMDEVMVITTAWWWCEQLMTQYFDPMRDGNLFCLGVHHANYAPVHFAERKSKGRMPDPHHDSFMNCRYAALNLASLSKFGSLEFRCMPSTTNVRDLDIWSRMCYNVCKVYESYKSPAEFMDAVFHKGAKDILYSIFRIDSVVDELTKRPDYERLLQANIALLVNYAYGGHLFNGVKKKNPPEEMYPWAGGVDEDFEDPEWGEIVDD